MCCYVCGWVCISICLFVNMNIWVIQCHEGKKILKDRREAAACSIYGTKMHFRECFPSDKSTQIFSQSPTLKFKTQLSLRSATAEISAAIYLTWVYPENRSHCMNPNPSIHEARHKTSLKFYYELEKSR